MDNPFNPEFFGAVPAFDPNRQDLVALRIDHALEFGMQSREDGPARRNELATLIDEQITSLYRQLATPTRGLAVVAHGALGRRDLGPVSPFDIAVIWDDSEPIFSSDHDPEAGRYDPQAIANSLWHGLWSLGASFKRGIYSLTQCRLLAGSEPEALIPLLDVRWLAGDRSVADMALERVRAAWKLVLDERADEVARFAKQRSSSYPLLAHAAEPNLILDRGGLRDATLISAITRGLPADSHWQSHPQQAPRIQAAASLLRDVRDALQVVRGAGTGRLLSSDYGAVAALTGFVDTASMMSAIADAGRTLSWELRRILRVSRSLHGESLLPAITGDATWLPPSTKLVIQNSSLHFLKEPQDDTLRLDTLAAIRFSATFGVDLGATILTFLRKQAPTTLAPLSKAEHEHLMAALCGEYLLDTYESLDVHAVIEAWIPGWAQVRNRPQHAGAHRFTQDRHLIETVRESARESTEPALLIAALTHSFEPTTAQRVATLLGLDSQSADDVGLLVAHHELLAELAKTRDLMDPTVVATVADTVHNDARLLALLSTLTVAHQRTSAATPVSTWHLESIEFLARAAHALIDSRNAVATDDTETAHALATLTGASAQAESLALDAVTSTGQAVAVMTQEIASDASRRIIIAAPEQPNAWLHVTHMAAEFGIELSSGQFEIKNGLMFSAWWVRPRGDNLPHPSVLRAYLNQKFGVSTQQAPRSARRTPPSPAAPKRYLDNVAVTLVESGAEHLTAIQINADDRPRLVVDIASAMAGFAIIVERAHVLRLESRSVVVVYFTDKKHKKVAPELVQRLTGVLALAAKSQ